MTLPRHTASSTIATTSGCCRTVPGRCSTARCTTWGMGLRRRTTPRRSDVCERLIHRGDLGFLRSRTAELRWLRRSHVAVERVVNRLSCLLVFLGSAAAASEWLNDCFLMCLMTATLTVQRPKTFGFVDFRQSSRLFISLMKLSRQCCWVTCVPSIKCVDPLRIFV